MYRSRNDRGVNKKNTFWNELERMKDKILNRYCVMVIVSKILKLREGEGAEAFGVDEKNKILAKGLGSSVLKGVVGTETDFNIISFGVVK